MEKDTPNPPQTWNGEQDRKWEKGVKSPRGETDRHHQVSEESSRRREGGMVKGQHWRRPQVCFSRTEERREPEGCRCTLNTEQCKWRQTCPGHITVQVLTFGEEEPLFPAASGPVAELLRQQPTSQPQQGVMGTMEGSKLSTWILHTVQHSFLDEGTPKTFSVIRGLRVFTTHRWLLPKRESSERQPSMEYMDSGARCPSWHTSWATYWAPSC